jgi:hypothetical protein
MSPNIIGLWRATSSAFFPISAGIIVGSAGASVAPRPRRVKRAFTAPA